MASPCRNGQHSRLRTGGGQTAISEQRAAEERSQCRGHQQGQLELALAALPHKEQDHMPVALLYVRQAAGHQGQPGSRVSRRVGEQATG